MGADDVLRLTERDFIKVCLDPRCQVQLPDNFAREIERRGFRLTHDEKQARYILWLRGFVTRTMSDRDGNPMIVPAYAVPLIAEERTGIALKPWIASPENVQDMKSRGLDAFALLTSDVRLYDTMWHQTGQLAQTIGGGSPGAYAAGYLLAPILNLVLTAKARNDLAEGLAGVELSFKSNGGFLGLFNKFYGFAASTAEEDPATLIRKAFDEAMRSVIFVRDQDNGATEATAIAHQEKEGA